MTMIGWAEIAFILALSAPVLGAYMARVFSGEATMVSRFIGPVERSFYRAAGVDPTKGQTWRGYVLAMLTFNAAGFVLLLAFCCCKTCCRSTRLDCLHCPAIWPSTPPSVL